MNTIASGTIVAFPSDAPGGLLASLSDHFGHCDLFTLVTVAGNGVGKVAIVPGIPHEHGGCMAPVNLLASHGAKVLVTGGMERQPLMGFAEVSIRVFHSAETSTVSDALHALLAGRLPMFDASLTCGGGQH